MPERHDDTPEARRTPDAAPVDSSGDGGGNDVEHDGRDAGARPEAPADGAAADPGRPREIGGQQGPEPTRYGDWEGKGRCTDF